MLEYWGLSITAVMDNGKSGSLDTKTQFMAVYSIIVGVHEFKGSEVQCLPASGGFHSCPRTPFRMRIYEKSVIFVRPNPKFGAKLAIIWENEHF